jgi:hypothetical protein
MLGTPAILIGMTGTALLALSLAGPALDGMSRSLQAKADATTSAKADRLRPPAASGPRATVSTVELIGVSRTTVILRDRDGAMLFKSDPLTNTTVVVKNAELPVVTLKEEATSPVVRQHPAAPQQGSQEPPAQKDRRAKPIGCDGLVSSLANREVSQVPALCLAGLFDGRRS